MSVQICVFRMLSYPLPLTVVTLHCSHIKCILLIPDGTFGKEQGIISGRRIGYIIASRASRTKKCSLQTVLQDKCINYSVLYLTLSH